MTRLSDDEFATWIGLIYQPMCAVREGEIGTR